MKTLMEEEIDYLLTYYAQLLPLSQKHNLKYPYLTPSERKQERNRLATLLTKKYADQIIWNRCPKCNQLARTPAASQCHSCYYRWA
ncbi:MAG: hypothetical protein AB8G15_13080 [Saprospiraceae bacterium]